MEYISDSLIKPDDVHKIIPWGNLSKKSQNTLLRAIERSDVSGTREPKGFSFDLLSNISLDDLSDARFIGPGRAKELIQELVSIFDDADLNKKLEAEQKERRLFPTKAVGKASER